jgi:glutamate:Na+ symporter, ESS family
MHDMSLEAAGMAVLLAAVLMLAAKAIRSRITLLRRIFLPSSIIAGALGLLLGPQGLDAWPQGVVQVWRELPSLLISVVFASLFLGKSVASPATIWARAGPMVAHGQTMAWGQYVVGLLLVMLVLTPLWGMNPMAGALIEIGFEGGHGTAAGLRGTFSGLGFDNGADLALALATVGVVTGAILGTLLINWAVWRGHLERPDRVERDDEDLSGSETLEQLTPDQRVGERAIEPLSIHLGFIGLAIGLGWLLLEGLVWLEREVLAGYGWPELLVHVPLFPLAMIGGVLVQLLGGRLGYAHLLDRRLVNRISGAALDLLIVAALGSLSLAAVGANAAPFLLIALTGIAWNLFGFFVLARWIFPDNWVPNGLANFGQGMGMTVIGLLLVRMSDPGGKAGTMEAFGYKQLLFEPVVGGGLFTAASLPLIAQFGPGPVLLGVTVLLLGWLSLGLLKDWRR